MDIALSSDFHAALYARAKVGDRDQLAEAWEAFSISYPEWNGVKDAWLSSRLEGASPLSIGIPWINYPATEYLDKFLDEQKRVFEWGVGGSTIFFRRRAAAVVSVEHDKKWFDAVEIRATASEPNAGGSSMSYVPPEFGRSSDAYSSGSRGFENASFSRYVRSIDTWPDGYFDLVAVDGRARTACCRAGAAKVRPGGALMLDNSDYARYQPELRELGLTVLAGWERREFLGPGPCSQTVGWKTTIWVKPFPSTAS